MMNEEKRQFSIFVKGEELPNFSFPTLGKIRLGYGILFLFFKPESISRIYRARDGFVKWETLGDLSLIVAEFCS